MLFFVLFLIFELVPIFICRYIITMGSFRFPGKFSLICYLLTGLLLHSTQHYVIAEFYDDEFKFLFYSVLRIGIAVLSRYWFRGNREYQKRMWYEFRIISRNNKDQFHSDTEYYYGYWDGYKQACEKHNINDSTLRDIFFDDLAK